MRARVGWTSSAVILGTGAGGIVAPIGLRSGPLGLLWLILLICGAALLLVTGSPAVRGRPTGQHRNGQYHFRQPRQPRQPRFRPFRSRPAVFLHYRFRQLRAGRTQPRAARTQPRAARTQPRASRTQPHAGSQPHAGGSQLSVRGTQFRADGSRPARSGTGQPGTGQPGLGRQWLSLSRQGRYQHPYQEPNTGQLPHGRHRRIGSAA